MKHSNLPFWIDDDGFKDSDENIFIASGNNETYRTIAEIIHAEADVFPEANSKLIINACNNYYDLLQACQYGLKFIESLPENETIGQIENKSVFKSMLKKVIKGCED